MGIHAEYSPSSAERWSICGGSVELSKGVKDRDTVYNTEGTRAHKVAAAMVRELMGETPIGSTRKMFDDVGQYPKEMFIAANKWASFIVGWARGGNIYVEHLWTYAPDVFGTADAVVLSKDRTHLLVADFKYGAGIPVTAQSNKQLMLYAAAAIRQNGPFSRVRTAELVVYQPRIEEVLWDSFVIPRGDLVCQVANFVGKARLNKKQFLSGEHCRFCKARSFCETLLNDTKTSFARGESLLDSSVTAEQLEEFLLKDAPRFGILVKALEGRLESELNAGAVVPNFYVGAGKSRRQWLPGVTMDQLRNEYGYEGEAKLPSPPDVEKATGVKIPSEHTQQFETSHGLRKRRVTSKMKEERAARELGKLDNSDDQIERDNPFKL